MVRQTEHLGEPAVVHRGQLAVVTEQLLHDCEGTHLIEINTDQNQSAEEVHTLTIANLWTVLRKGSQYIEKRVLL